MRGGKNSLVMHLCIPFCCNKWWRSTSSSTPTPAPM